MTELIALISTGKGSWSQVAKLINSQEWEKVYLITNDFGTKFTVNNTESEYIVVDFEKEIEELCQDIAKELEEKINDFEVAVNMTSGTGKQHMALISAIMKVGLGFRLVSFNEEFKELNTVYKSEDLREISEN